MKILVIDDESSIRWTLKEILSFDGHEVDVTDNGKAGLELARKHRYGLIFLDLKMPEMAGDEVLRVLSVEGNPTPVVMISGHSDVDSAVRCIQGGAFDFMQKPLDLNRVINVIKRASSVGERVQNFQIIVMDTTNTIINEKISNFHNMGLTIIDWAKDMQFLREMLPLHLSPDVSSSMKADAVLVNLNKGGG